MLRRKDLRKRIDRVTKLQTDQEMKVMIDYTRNTFYQRDLKKQGLIENDNNKIMDNNYGRSKPPSDVKIALLEGIKRLITYQTFQR